MSKAFHTREEHLELLRDSELDTILGVSESTLFLAEVAFLNFWNHKLEGLPQEYGLEEYDAIEEAGGPTIYVSYDKTGNGNEDDFDRVAMIYAPDPANPGRYGLQIIWNDELVYERTADQDEKTEWNINCMTNDPDITDDNGNMLFAGEPVNI